MNIAEELARLPSLGVPGADPPAAPPSPLGIVSKQGRLLLRLGAATESLEGRYAALADQISAQYDLLATASDRVARAEDAQKDAEARARQAALAAVQLMDALDWVYELLAASGDGDGARDVDAARRDCLRRLAGAGIAELPAVGAFDGRLHEGLEAVPAPDGVPPYHIVRVVRRGFQVGPDVLRRAGVVTALS